VSRPTPDRPDEDQDEATLSRLVSEAGDPTVEPRPGHVADLRALILDRLGPPRADRPSTAPWLVVSGLAAACLLAALVWPRGGGNGPAPGAPGRQSPNQVATRPRPDPAGLAAWRNVRRDLDVSAMPAFSWPLQQPSGLSVLTAIPPDLLD
jgi:hypothetical protein